MFKNLIKVSLVAFVFIASAEAFSAEGDPTVVSKINLRRYMGLWYEIAHSPNFFQAFCESSTAQYQLRTDGAVKVLNTCYRGGAVFDTIEGVATIPDPAVPAKLVVDFGYFRKGHYWIVALDPSYRWAVVSGPQKESLFILSRSAPMKRGVLHKILNHLNHRGFDTGSLVYDKY